MKKKLVLAIIVTLMITVSIVTLVEASTPATIHESFTSTVVANSLANSPKCQIDSYETAAANLLGQQLYLYHLDVEWCYDGKKAWTKDVDSYGQTNYPFISYKGDKIKTLRNNTSYFTTTGTATFYSSVGIPTKWGTFGFKREAHPWVKITGYYYGNVGKNQSPF